MTKAKRIVESVPGEKPKLPPLDADKAAAEANRHAIEGNRKLTLAIDGLRLAVQEMELAEWDHVKKREVTAADLRRMATEALNQYGRSTKTPPSRRRIVPSHVGDRNLDEKSFE